MRKLIAFIQVLGQSVKLLGQNDPLRMAAATAFFTTFALPAILVILIQVLGIFIDRRTVSAHLFEHLAVILGSESGNQLRDVLRGFRRIAENPIVTILLFVFLLFVATTLFKVIRDSINQLWSIRGHKRKGIQSAVQNRLIAFAVILVAGILFLLSLFAEGIQALLRDYISEVWSRPMSSIFSIFNQVISLIVVTVWFAILFRFLPNGRPEWRICIAGGLFTGVLFTIGKLVVRYFLSMSNINDIYGASGSFVLILLFVFYASFMLYYGAMFTKVWAEYRKRPIRPNDHSYSYIITEIEKTTGVL